MIVEDNKADVFLIREAIEQSGVNADIDVLRDGYAARTYFQAADADETVFCPDLILLDLNLPKISGFELLKYLRGSGRCRSIRVLIVSSSDAPADRASVEHLAAGYFKKPSVYTDFMKLGTIVKEMLDQGSQPS